MTGMLKSADSNYGKDFKDKKIYSGKCYIISAVAEHAMYLNFSEFT
jgi:hypothetical protein